MAEDLKQTYAFDKLDERVCTTGAPTINQTSSRKIITDIPMNRCTGNYGVEITLTTTQNTNQFQSTSVRTFRNISPHQFTKKLAPTFT